MAWTVATLDQRVDGEILEFSSELQARLARTVELIETVGLPNVHQPHVRNLEGKLWEIRVSGKGDIGRAIYVTAAGQKVIILRAFQKKTQKTPRREIDLATKRATDAGLKI